MMNDGLLLIGEVARLCGVSDDTIRHYERKGLIRAAKRTEAGYRRFARDTVSRVRVVRAALTLGFTLDELSRIFRRRSEGEVPCRQVRSLAAEKLRQVEEQIVELTVLRGSLIEMLARWDRRLEQVPEHEPAHLLESLTTEGSS